MKITMLLASAAMMGVVFLAAPVNAQGRVEMWRGGVRLSMSVCRPFRLAVP